MTLSIVRQQAPMAYFGGQFDRVRTVTEATTLDTTDRVVFVDSTGGGFNVTLPPLSESYLPEGVGQNLRVVMIADGGDVILVEDAADGAATVATLDDAGDSIGVIARSATAWTVMTDQSTVGSDAIDESELEVNLAFTIALPFTLGNRSGPGSDGVLIGTITNSAIGDCNVEDNSGATFVSETTDVNDADANDVALLEPFDTDDAIYFGADEIFYALRVTVGTAGAGDDVATETVWEYSQGGDAWATLESGHELVDDSVALTAGTSTYLVSFVPPADWAVQAVDGGTAMYHIRLRADADDVYNTTTPLITQAWVKKLGTGQGVVCPTTGTVTAVDLSAFTASATNNDTELLLVNITQEDFAQLTWTGGDATDRITGLTLSVTAGDQLAIVCVAEDGTTEFANGQAILQIDV